MSFAQVDLVGGTLAVGQRTELQVSDTRLLASTASGRPSRILVSGVSVLQGFSTDLLELDSGAQVKLSACQAASLLATGGAGLTLIGSLSVGSLTADGQLTLTGAGSLVLLDNATISGSVVVTPEALLELRGETVFDSTTSQVTPVPF